LTKTWKPINAKFGYTVEIDLHPKSFQRSFGISQVFGKAPDIEVSSFSANVSVRPKAPSQEQGWIYVGTLKNGTWDAEHTVEGTVVPQAGDIRKIVYPANIRDEAGSQQPLIPDVVSAFQTVKFIEVQTNAATTWAKIEVQ
jgi:hypothetical protein